MVPIVLNGGRLVMMTKLANIGGLPFSCGTPSLAYSIDNVGTETLALPDGCWPAILVCNAPIVQLYNWNSVKPPNVDLAFGGNAAPPITLLINSRFSPTGSVVIQNASGATLATLASTGAWVEVFALETSGSWSVLRQG